jgi:enoyl-CoA hydratase
MSHSALLTEQRGSILLLTINRPEARNSINKEVATAIAESLDRLDDDDRLSIAVITGTGGGFCGGMDLKGFAKGELPVVGDRGFAGIAARSARKPIIAAVEGYALAGGLEIALACDLIVAARDAKFGIPEVRVGLFAGAGGLYRLPRRVGLGRAMRLGLTGAPISGEEGHRIGLVDYLVEPGEALDEACNVATTIAANAPLALAATKAVLLEGGSKTEEEFWPWQVQHIRRVFSSSDAKEGPRAFAEKRAPVWQGR